MNRNIIDYVKSKWDCLTYAQSVLGLPVHQEGDRCKSFRPDAERPDSLLIFSDHWCDFGSGERGDVIDLCAEARHNGDVREALKELAGDYFQNLPGDYVQYINDLDAKIWHWHKQLRPEDFEYLHARGITDSTINRLRLGFRYSDCRLTIPYWKNGHTVFYASRDRSGAPDAKKYLKAPIDDYNQHVPWGLHTLTPEFKNNRPEFLTCSNGTHLNYKNILCILEGAFDVMSFEQEHFCVLSPICGHFSQNQISTVLAAAKQFDSVFICFDSDIAGKNFQEKMARFCFSHRLKFSCGVLPHGIKDVSDFYAAGGNLADLVLNARNGLDTLASLITDKEEFSNFLRDAARFAFPEDVVQLINNAEQFPGDWRKALKNQVLRAPNENIIIQELLKSRDIKFVPKGHFFEYRHNVWEQKPDEYIDGYIADTLGMFATGSRLSSISKLLKARVKTSDDFNTLHIFNFVNGILDLETGELKNHDKAYNSSIQVPFLYDKKARCPRFLEFIDEIANDDYQTKTLLQEMAGYPLFPDCSLQKAFILIGDGANGKSVLIDTLSALYGENNCSNVDISQLASPFDPIRLRYSLVNFSAETKSKLNDAESKFKACVTGDKISAAYKGKDAIEFRTRAKWICAANSFMSSNDVTYGMTRRLIFINFTRTFEGDKADKTLTQKLRAELPGIFNWAYEGYKRLRQNLEFTETEEGTALKDDFLRSINPVAAFIDEEIFNLYDAYLSGNELYTRYTTWCKDSGCSAQSRINFGRNFSKLMKQKRPDAYSSKKNGSSMWIFPKEGEGPLPF